MKKLIKKFQWCPQPQKSMNQSFPTATLKHSPKILAVVILVEVIALLIGPLTYLAFLGPNLVYSEGKQLELTNDQIKKAWPNLPTGDEIKNSGAQYNFFNSYSHVQNCTNINMYVNACVARPPLAYCIYVKDSTGYMIQVPDQYLATENPPEIQPDGFMGTYLPTTYVVGASMVLLLTVAIGVFIVSRKRL
jgi:hypothetical protein